MIKSYKSRKNCRLCDNKNIELAVQMGSSPVADKYLNHESEKNDVLKVPLDLYYCHNCAHVQLNDIVNPDYLWLNYTFHTGQFNQKLVDHFKKIVKKLTTDFPHLKKNNFILDIGSNDGSLLKAFKDENFSNLLGIDPAKNVVDKANENKIKTFLGYFNQKNSNEIHKNYGKAEIITSFNAFAHSDNLREMAECIKNLLDTDGIFIFEASYLLDIFEKSLIGTIFHEHLDYHSVYSLNLFFKSFGLNLFKIERNEGQGGSIVGYVQHNNGKFKMDNSVEKLIDAEIKKIISIEKIKKMNNSFLDMKKKINQLLNSLKNEKKNIAGFGSSISSTTFLSYFQIGKYLDYIVDDNKQKQNKLTPTDQIKIFPTNEIYKRKTDYLIIFAWIHTEKIIKNYSDFINKGGKFIKLFPNIEIFPK